MIKSDFTEGIVVDTINEWHFPTPQPVYFVEFVEGYFVTEEAAQLYADKMTAKTRKELGPWTPPNFQGYKVRKVNPHD